MSVELQTSPRTQNTTEASSRAPAKRSYSEFLKGVNTRFKHLSDKVLPASPYLLKVPTERPFHLGSRFASNWAVGDNRPFAPEEEHLQYMTFLPHQGEDTLLVAVGGWSDERGNIMEEDMSKVPSIATSPSVDTPKHKLQRKKISLSEYKKKAYETPRSPRSTTSANRRNGTDRLPPAVKPKSPREPVPTAKLLAISPAKRKDTTFIATDDRSDNAIVISQAKSARDGNSRSTPNTQKPPPPARESPPPTKKPRLSTAKEPPDNKPTRQRNAPPVVPALLSPTLPPTSVTPPLPRLLSPTLPPDIEEELAKIKDGELSIDRISSPRKAPSSSTIIGSKPERPLPMSNKHRLHSSSISSSSDKTTKARVSASSSSKPEGSSVAKPVPSNSQRSGAVDRTLSQISSKPRGTTQLAKAKLIVKLRYGRANRKRIEALLKFSGKCKITPDHQSSKQKREPESSQRKSQTIPSSKSTEVQRAEKRPRQTDEEDSQGSVAKRQKSATLPVAERPRTPATTAFKSPSVPQQPTAASKGQFLTPSKDLRATTMRRLGSGDGDSKLAGLDRAMNTSTPGSAEKATTKHSPVTPSDNPQSKPRDTAESRSWQEESQKYFNLGRELKHSSKRYTGPHATDADHKLSAAIAVEAVLCFILAFILDDRHRTLTRRLGDSSAWLSIVPYWKMVKGNMDKYPHLHALCSLLGAVFHEVIHGLDLERLAMTLLPGDHSPAPTPGSDGNTVTPEESKRQQQHRDFMDLRKRLVDSHRDARALWLEGSRKLSEEVLTRQYPETWSKRSMNFSERGREKSFVLGEYSGEYFLPLDRTATPLEAIRFGWMFLTEWTEKEGVKWKGRLGL
ncbi:hypothetical protein ACJ73_03581 [Blastomyces percursus]|uniref:Ell binding protein Ebp1 C-terminal domain-containing protein n=1 Tax=Blastomyces percursus TaxID=1658174 RepID=A0A1J9RBK8_9EURO|nr:hypothetical protein ACJ73_03581 [Blastomyces percursus]